jgi:D-alanine-D-alanine ligase
MMTKQTVAVLFGGQSGEHEVSLVSAHAVMGGLDRARYHVLPIGIAKDGTWLVGSNTLARLVAQADPHKLPTGVDWQTTRSEEGTDGHIVMPAPQQQSWHPGALFRALHIDVVFPVLHGPMGEDGTVQGLFELAGLPYVGCGVAASAVSLDKALMKAAFAAAGLPQLPWLLVRRHEWKRAPERIHERIEEQLAYPVFVKPANMGSSVGVNKATNRAELDGALAEAATYDRRIVIEQGISAREVEVSVLGNDDPSASTPGEIVPAGEWYDYRAKYIGGQSQIVIPAPIEQALKEQVRALAVQAFEAVDGAGLARVDFLLDRESGALWLNEVNTMPGFTSVSMYAKMWEASGVPYRDLLDRLIALARERHSARH